MKYPRVMKWNKGTKKALVQLEEEDVMWLKCLFLADRKGGTSVTL